MENYSFCYDLRNYSFCRHVVNIWNSLPDYVVDTNKLDKFQTRIGEFRQHQDVLFSYKSELSGTEPISSRFRDTAAKRRSPLFFAYVI